MTAEETTDGGHYTPPQVFSVADPDNPKIVCNLAVRDGVTEMANGHIIAAAPEMAEILKRILANPAWLAISDVYDGLALLKKAGVI